VVRKRQKSRSLANPSRLKAEIKIAETQAKDIQLGQKAEVDTRNGIVEGRVARIDPSVINGTRTVDVTLMGELPKGAVPDLSVDGTIELERLNDVLFMGRPAFGQDQKAQRGKYLVEEVARCQECHTPKTDAGDLDTAKMLKGAKLNVAPIATITGWHAASPDLTSTSPLWQRWGEDGLVKFLETAKNPRGGKAGAPMPAYVIDGTSAGSTVLMLVRYLNASR